MHDKHDTTKDETALAIGLDKRPGFGSISAASVEIEIVHLAGVT